MTPYSEPLITATRVVANDLRFKASLKIGEEAYKSLRLINKARELWDVVGAAGTGAAVAKSSIIASTFFAPSGLLGILGIGTAATPIGWVALATVASGGACYGLYRLLGKGHQSRVIEIPKYINTPLDQLGLAIFDLVAPLALRLAAIDGQIEPGERAHLENYLCTEWGLDKQFVREAVDGIATDALTAPLEQMARERAELMYANPDCNHEEMARDLIKTLREMLESTGPLSKDEVNALAIVTDQLLKTPPGTLTRAWATARSKFQKKSIDPNRKTSAGGLTEATAHAKSVATDLALRSQAMAADTSQKHKDKLLTSDPVADGVPSAKDNIRGLFSR